jgi:energy-coupling factor transporter ATP-binding protein EcfA2
MHEENCMVNTLINIQDLNVKYSGNNKFSLYNIDLTVHESEIIAIMGSAGAGKTTLLLTLNSIIPNSIKVSMSGKVEVNGLNTKKFGVKDFAKKVGVVFQDPDNQLFCASVEEEVGYGLSNHELPREIIKERVREALESVRLEGYEERIPQSLSGGEKQRVALASALSLYPKILVLDEPTSQLDPMGSREIFEVIDHLRRQEKITVVIAEHKSEEIAEIVDKIIVLKKGEKVLEGTPKEIFRKEQITENYGIRAPQISEAALILNKKSDQYSPDLIPVTYKEARAYFRKR